MWTIFELASFLKVSTRTVRSWWAQGKIPEPMKIGHMIRWPEAVIEKWIEGGCLKMSEQKSELAGDDEPDILAELTENSRQAEKSLTGK